MGWLLGACGGRFHPAVFGSAGQTTWLPDWAELARKSECFGFWVERTLMVLMLVF